MWPDFCSSTCCLSAPTLTDRTLPYSLQVIGSVVSRLPAQTPAALPPYYEGLFSLSDTLNQINVLIYKLLLIMVFYPVIETYLIHHPLDPIFSTSTISKMLQELPLCSFPPCYWLVVLDQCVTVCVLPSVWTYFLPAVVV